MTPTTTLPSELAPQAPQVQSASDLVNQGAGIERGQLASMGLNVDNSNPVFGDDAANNYASRYFDMAYQPEIGNSAISQYMAGNFGNKGSTFGASYLSNLEEQGRRQSFFAGQDFKNNEIGNVLNRRGAFFGQPVALGQQQNQSEIQRAMGLNDQSTQRLGMMNDTTTQRLGMMNNFNLGSAGVFSDNFNQQQNRQSQQQAAQTASMGNLIGGGMGIVGGLIGGGMGGGKSLGGFSGGSSPFSMQPPKLSFMGSPLNSNQFRGY